MYCAVRQRSGPESGLRYSSVNKVAGRPGRKRYFGFGLVLAVIVDGVFRVGLDVGAVRFCFFVAAKDHVGRNADERRVVAGRERGCVNALAVIQKAAAGGVAFACFEGAVSAGVNDRAKMELLEKFSQTFRFFGIDAENVVSKNARMLDGANANNAVAKQLIEMSKERVAGNSVQPEN